MIGGSQSSGSSSPDPSDWDIKTTRERARHLTQNNPYAATAVRTLSNYMVGKGIKPHADDKKTEKVLKEWADGTGCDLDERLSLYGIQALVLKHLVVDGEVFIQKVIDPKDKVPLKLRILEADYLAHSNKKNVIGGIEYDNKGRRVAYHFWENHPNAQQSATLNKVKRVPASQVIHLYHKQRASQSRGISFLAPIMLRLKAFDEFEDAELVRQRNASCYVGFYRSLDGGDFITEEEEKGRESEIRPGSIFSAPSGETLEFNQPPQVGNYAPYSESMKHTLAIGTGIPYFLLSGDFSKVNYSSARMCMLTFYRYVDQITEHLMIDQFLRKVEEWLRDCLILRGINLSPLVWSAPKKELTDPIKEIEAYKLAVEEGFIPHSQAIREMGDDPEDTYEEIFKLDDFLTGQKAHFKQPRKDLNGSTSKENAKEGKPRPKNSEQKGENS